MIGVEVEFAFGSSWLDDPAGYTWVDESARCEEVQTTRGRSSELELFSAGTATIVLDSAGRRFDPLNTAGPYFGLLVPGVPVRIIADAEAVFYGFVDGWDNAIGTYKGTVTVTATDAFKYLANMPLRSVYEYDVAALSPWVYWRLGGEVGDEPDASGNRRQGVYALTGVARSDDNLVPFVAGGSSLIESPLTKSAVASRDELARRTSLPIVVEFWCQAEPDAVDPAGFFTLVEQGDVDPGNVANRFVIAYDNQFTPLLAVNLPMIGGTAYSRNYTSPNLADGRPHHVVVGATAAGAIRAFVDGVELAQFGAGAAIFIQANPSRLGIGSLQGSTTGDSWPGIVDEFAVYASDAALTARPAIRAARPWDGDYTGERVERILDLIGWPAALRDVDRGDVICGNADIGGVTALEYLQVLELTEGGRLFIARDGKLTFHGANRTVPSPSTFTYDEVDADSISFSMDDTFVYDGAEIQRKYGVTQYVGAELPTRVYSATGLAMRDDAIARARAERVVARYRTPKTRAKTWAVQQPTNLDLELGDVVDVALDAPEGTGDPIELDLFVEQVTYQFTPEDYGAVLYGSPLDDRDLFRFAGPNTTGPLNGFAAGVLR